MPCSTWPQTQGRQSQGACCRREGGASWPVLTGYTSRPYPCLLWSYINLLPSCDLLACLSQVREGIKQEWSQSALQLAVACSFGFRSAAAGSRAQCVNTFPSCVRQQRAGCLGLDVAAVLRVCDFRQVAYSLSQCCFICKWVVTILFTHSYYVLS